MSLCLSIEEEGRIPSILRGRMEGLKEGADMADMPHTAERSALPPLENGDWQGLGTPEHAAFVARLSGKGTEPPSE